MKRFLIVLALVGGMQAVTPSPSLSVELCQSVYVQVDSYWQRRTQCSPIRPNSVTCYTPTVSNHATGKPVVVSATICYPTG